MRKHLLSWQWSGYPEAHRDRKNFILHLATVPLFDVGFLAVIASPLLGWAALAAGAAAMVVAVGLQGRGHRREQKQPEPFTGPLDFVSRLLVEQLITFPRFVLSGHWR
jgi:Protein of unknown function (DUF962)